MLNPDLNSDARLSLAQRWLSGLPATLGLQIETLSAPLDDGSFRRYFRVDAGQASAILMDAPPPQEDCRPFAHVTQLLQAAGVNVPRILAADLEQGFMLLTDLGVSTYYQTLTRDLTRGQVNDATLQTLYRQAIAALVHMQQAATTGLPVYSAARMREELTLFTEWYVPHCQTALTQEEAGMLNTLFADLVKDNVAQPQVFVHRDFHSPNLMHIQHAQEGQNPGIIDHQDALSGPITYDVASLVMDARLTWEEAQQLDWTIRYWQAARQAGLPVAADVADFHRACEWMALQRNLRILGVFVRLSQRDGKPQYLAHLPRVMRYVRQVAERYDHFRGLLRLLDRLENRQPQIPFRV